MTKKTSRVSTFLDTSWTILRPSLREMAYTPFYWAVGGLVLSYALVAVWLLHGKDIPVNFFAYFGVIFKPAGLVIFVLLYLGWPRGLREKLARFYYKQHVVSGLVLVFVAQVFHSIFLTFKMFYSSFVPFWADSMFSTLDKNIHFGRLPWDWISHLFSNRIVMSVVDYGYAFWLPADLLMLLWMGITCKKPDVRATYFLTYFTTWIVLGTIFALIYSSAGPCYFDRVAPDAANPYQEQMSYLQSFGKPGELLNMNYQRLLWQNFLAGADGIINGISAFPSMHVSGALLFVLAGWHYGRVMRAVTGAYFLLILVGSVVLGWHYAVDGYFSIIITPLLWLLNSWLVRRFALWKPVKTLV